MFSRMAVAGIISCVVLVSAAAWVLVPAWSEYSRTEKALAKAERRLLAQQRINEDLRAETFRLKTDNRTIERVSRDKFNYARPNETIYDFTPPAGEEEPSDTPGIR